MRAPSIASVSASAESGRIGIVPCPGQRPAPAPSPSAGALRHDLLALRASEGAPSSSR
jgi:hypothetical protein